MGNARARAVSAVAALSPGQRWTASLACALAVVVLAFGLPEGARVLVREPAAAAAATPAPNGPAPVAEGPAAAEGPANTQAPTGAGAPADPGGATDPASPLPSAGGTEGPAAAPGVVALVSPARPVPDPRGDEALARRYLAAASLPAEVVAIAEDGPTCAAVITAGTLAIASGALAAPLRRCLTEGGVSVISFDHAGGADGVLATRRGAAASLLDTAARLRRAAPLTGRVGIVVDRSLRPAVDAVLPALRRRGVDVVDVVSLSGDDAGSEITAAVLGFAGNDIGTVVFATTVRNQGLWAAQHVVVRPGVRFVVADAFDSIVEEGYPAVFDGAVAVTSIAVPWSDRGGDVPAPRQRCLDVWEADQAAPLPLEGLALQRALAWCQHILLAAAAVGGQPLAEVELPSILTSRLGPLPGDARFGPQEDAVLRWRAACACWEREQPFAERSDG